MFVKAITFITFIDHFIIFINIVAYIISFDSSFSINNVSDHIPITIVLDRRLSKVVEIEPSIVTCIQCSSASIHNMFLIKII